MGAVACLAGTWGAIAGRGIAAPLLGPFLWLAARCIAMRLVPDMPWRRPVGCLVNPAIARICGSLRGENHPCEYGANRPMMTTCPCIPVVRLDMGLSMRRFEWSAPAACRTRSSSRRTRRRPAPQRITLPLFAHTACQGSVQSRVDSRKRNQEAAPCPSRLLLIDLPSRPAGIGISAAPGRRSVAGASRLGPISPRSGTSRPGADGRQSRHAVLKRARNAAGDEGRKAGRARRAVDQPTDAPVKPRKPKKRAGYTRSAAAAGRGRAAADSPADAPVNPRKHRRSPQDAPDHSRQQAGRGGADQPA